VIACGKRFGRRREHVCKRLAGHPGQHKTRLSVHELRAVLAIQRAGRK
jgi:hypothetical protein